jgi:very-short-patch-repair endonuclease
MHRPFTSLAEFASTRTGVFTSAEAIGLGVSRSALSRSVARGSLERIGTRHYRFVGQFDNWYQRVDVALGDTGPRSWLTAGTAARFHRFDGFAEFDPIEVLVPRSCRNRSSAVAIVHSSTSTRLVDCSTTDGVRVTSPARTIIELARTSTSNELERAVDSAVSDGGTSPVYLAKRLRSLRGTGRAGARMLDAVLVDAGGSNALERRMLRIIREAHLPKPTCQVIHRRDGKTVARVDFQFSGTNIVVEVDGQVAHATPRQRQHDAQRRRELDDIGVRVLTFVHDEVFHHPHRVTRDLLRVFASRVFPDSGKSGDTSG